MHELGAAFHLEIARCAKNHVAESFMHSILDLLTERGRRADNVPDARKRELADHEHLLAVLRNRDGEAAREAMLEHIVSWAGTYDGTSGATLAEIAERR